MVPHRENYWNVGDERYLVIPIGIAAIVILVWTFRKHYLLWRLGRKEDRFDRPWDRLRGLLVYGFANRSVLNEAYPGLMHLLIYGGMVVLFFGTVMDSANYYLNKLASISFLQGSLYLWYSLVLDVAGALLIVGLLLAVFRRYVRRPERLDNVTEDWIALGWLGIIVMSGFLVEGFRIAVSEIGDHPDWAVWSPVGYLLALSFNAWGVPASLQLALHRVLWLLHMVSAQTWIAYIFYSKLGHIFTAPLNIYFRNLHPGGALQPILDIDKAETLGAGTVRDLTWKQLLDLDACTRCGRCQDNCPAYLTDQPLSPKKLIQDLKTQMVRVASVSSGELRNGVGAAVYVEPLAIVGETIAEAAIWSCTTCGGCQTSCPVFVEHIGKIVDIRRNLILTEGRMPEGIQSVLANLERRGHPWMGAQSARTDWIDDFGIKSLEPNEEVELLYWVGCTGALESRSRKITNAVAKLLQVAGVRFGVLGSEEGCCGDPARRMGNEYLYQALVQQNIEVLRSHNVRRIVTHCPHCFNALKNEYPQFGGDFEVAHHSQLLLDLVRQGKLMPSKASDENTVIHDSCYLGRHNGIYAAPRDLLKTIPGLRLAEMRRSRHTSFCCGAGGGRMWLDDVAGRRINEARVEQALETRASQVAVSCPFCVQMFEAGIRTKDAVDRLEVRDIAELLEESQG